MYDFVLIIIKTGLSYVVHNISFDSDTAKILEKHAEGNLSRWICDLIKKNYNKK